MMNKTISAKLILEDAVKAGVTIEIGVADGKLKACVKA